MQCLKHRGIKNNFILFSNVWSNYMDKGLMSFYESSIINNKMNTGCIGR
nr:hypothetical protein [Mucilaginibacter sp. SP1R1]